MSILLVGEFSEGEYTQWHATLAACLPRGETLYLPHDDFDPASIDVALVANPPVRSLAHLPNLRLIQSLWAGVDRLLSDPTLPPDVPIVRLVDSNLTQAMTECALAAVMFLHRQLPAYARQQASSVWKKLPQPLAQERRVGALGFGQLGRAVARALVALSFDVGAWSAGAHTDERIKTWSGPAGLRSLIERTDILINLLPLTPETSGILNAQLFRQLPKGASIINLARGRHLNENHLLEALAEGQISCAILDVFEDEPLPPEHPFWSHPRVIVLPHIAAVTDLKTAAKIAAENVEEFRAGRMPAPLVARSRGY
jgi:glyoxylate/hydroxypyruvate reductase A